MKKLTPAFLLQNPDIVRPLAPWCEALDNLQLAILLLTQPWIAGDGLSRADIERRLNELASDMPVGPMYFQRTNRAVLELEEKAALRGSGSGRGRRFALAPKGYAALILNVQVLRADPIADPGEFEFKRELVAAWNLMLEHILAIVSVLQFPPKMVEFFGALDQLTIGGRRVITPDVVKDAFNVLKLIACQRERVDALKKQAQDRLRGLGVPQIDIKTMSDSVPFLEDNPEFLDMIHSFATGAMPRLSIQARIAHLEAHQKYLDSLAKMYSKELRIVDMEVFRRHVMAQGG